MGPVPGVTLQIAAISEVYICDRIARSLCPTVLYPLSSISQCVRQARTDLSILTARKCTILQLVSSGLTELLAIHFIHLMKFGRVSTE